MGSSPINKMASKLLVIAFALLAVANAADIYSSSYDGLTCAGTATSTSKITLDKCYNNGDGGYEKVYHSATSGTYTFTTFGTDTTCTTSTSGLIAAIDTCVETGATASSPTATGSGKFQSSYTSGALATYDCTSGTCVAASASNSASHVTVGTLVVLTGLVVNLFA